MDRECSEDSKSAALGSFEERLNLGLRKLVEREKAAGARVQLAEMSVGELQEVSLLHEAAKVGVSLGDRLGRGEEAVGASAKAGFVLQRRTAAFIVLLLVVVIALRLARVG